MRRLDACPEVGFVFNAYNQLDPAGRVERIYREPLPECAAGQALLELYFRRWRFDSPVYAMVMARRSAYLETGLLDPRFGMYADVDMWLRLANVHGVAYVSEPLISLPSRQSLPSHWTGGRRQGKRITRRIFWEARMRRYANEPIRRSLEAARHYAFVVTDETLDRLLAIRRVLLRKHRDGTVESANA